jgi:hypothetical protein
MKTHTVTLDYDQISEIVRETLVSDYQMLCNDIAKLEKDENNLPDFKKQDLKDIREWHNHLKNTLRYYLTPKEYASIIGS